jgi:restriction system protein
VNISRAIRPYVCAECGAPIKSRTVYFRDEPHPLARHHRGIKVRHVCTLCVTGRPESDFGRSPNLVISQITFDFSKAVSLLPGLLMQAVVRLGDRTEEGHLVEAVTIPWFTIVSKLERDPAFLSLVPWHKLEELVAGGYEQAGYIVTLTPRSGDGGRDIIAVKHDVCSIRIIDQIKAYKPGNRVSANDVRALLGVLYGDLNASNGVVTTSAEFAPGIYNDPGIKPLLPYRLELRNGAQLRKWLVELKQKQKA